MATVEEFVQQYGPSAARAAQTLKVDPAILLGQFGLETGWGKSVIPGTNNLGNIKDFSGGGALATDNATGSQDRYRAYDTPDTFMDDYVGLIQRKYPNAVGLGDDAVKYARALKFGGYAEDPAYINKVSSATDMVRGLGEKLANFLISAASAETLPNTAPPDRMQALERALMKADAAGNVVDAKALADEIRRLRGASAPAPTEGGSAQGEFLPDGGFHVSMSHTGPAESAPAQQEPASQEPDLTDRLLRQGGLTLRAGMTGLGQTVGIVTEPLRQLVVNPIARQLGLPDAGSAEDFASSLADAYGLPKPENGAERVAQDVAGALTGVGGVAKLGAVTAEKVVDPIARGIAELFSKNVGTQASSVALGKGLGSAAKEGGASPGTQIALELAGGLLPTATPTAVAGLTRRAVRGGEAGRQAMADRAQRFERATGTMPTVGQAAGSTILQGVENQLGKTLGSVGVMTRKAREQVEALRDQVEGVARGLSPAAGAVDAGESVARGLQGFKDGFRGLQRQLYSALDDFLPGDAPIRVARTQEALKGLTADIDGAESVSRLFKNAKIGGLSGALSDDLERSARAQIPAGGSLFNPPKPDLLQATLPYESIKKLRSLVGEQLADQSFLADVPRSKWKALYAALSDDLGDAATAAGPQAAEAWGWANRFTRQQMRRLEDLAGVMNKDGPEKIFQAAMSGTGEGHTVLKRVFDALPKENRRDMAAAVLRRMGRATPGRQNDLGDVFSPDTFLTNWARMSPEARNTLFGRLGIEGIESSLMRLTNAANMMRESSKAFANLSGTGADIRLAAQLGGGGLALASGNLLPAAIALGAAPAAANTAARLTTNPDVVRWLFQKTEANPATAAILGNIISRLPR
ncbi:MAG: glucosaminidase domain-containing protein [Castellaniella sp.]|uniref:glycoside hydrolase family 73 protein n=1 Tax=Castellaniella sp. TaxID=1955812 RepID=UPI003C769283